MNEMEINKILCALRDEIFCETCPYNIESSECITDGCYFIHAANTIESLQAENAELKDALEKADNDRWISVGERLPDNGTYLCVRENAMYDTKHQSVSILCYAKRLKDVDAYDFKRCKHGGFYDYDSEWGYCEWDNITHWRPLPEPPTKEDKPHE